MTWRLYQKQDESQVAALHAALQARVGEQFDLPALDERPVLISLVREDDGVIAHAIYLEAHAEVCAMGESPIPEQEWAQAEEQLVNICALYRIPIVRAFVPAAALETKRADKPSAIERLLHHFRFVREDVSRLAPFTRRMG